MPGSAQYGEELNWPGTASTVLQIGRPDQSDRLNVVLESASFQISTEYIASGVFAAQLDGATGERTK